jgi:hypothetical protein
MIGFVVAAIVVYAYVCRYRKFLVVVLVVGWSLAVVVVRFRPRKRAAFKFMAPEKSV